MTTSIEQMFPGMHQDGIDHLKEIAEESGIDLDEEFATSSEKEIMVDGYPRPIQTWYQECEHYEPYYAFIPGLGSFRAWTPEEAAQAAAKAAAAKLVSDAGQDLLTALLLFMEQYDGDCPDRSKRPEIIAARAAIAKATQHPA